MARHEQNASGMMKKWSCKPPEQKTERLRENQRRHRQRVKSHISELETRLEDTLKQLEDANRRISELTDELALERSKSSAAVQVPQDSPSSSHDISHAPASSISDEERSAELAANQRDAAGSAQGTLSDASTTRDRPAPPQRHVPPTSPRRDVEKTSCARTSSSSTCTAKQTGCTRPNTSTEGPGSPCPLLTNGLDCGAVGDGGGGKAGCRLQPPSQTESTMLCHEAQLIIAQQNFKDLDLSTISTWLRPGFRGSTFEGSGCRVQTDILFAVLDHISQA